MPGSEASRKDSLAQTGQPGQPAVRYGHSVHIDATALQPGRQVTFAGRISQSDENHAVSAREEPQGLENPDTRAIVWWPRQPRSEQQDVHRLLMREALMLSSASFAKYSMLRISSSQSNCFAHALMPSRNFCS